MSDLAGNPEDRFSHNEAQIFLNSCILINYYLSTDTVTPISVKNEGSTGPSAASTDKIGK